MLLSAVTALLCAKDVTQSHNGRLVVVTTPVKLTTEGYHQRPLNTSPPLTAIPASANADRDDATSSTRHGEGGGDVDSTAVLGTGTVMTSVTSPPDPAVRPPRVYVNVSGQSQSVRPPRVYVNVSGESQSAFDVHSTPQLDGQSVFTRWHSDHIVV